MALWVRQFGDICCRYTREETPKNDCPMHAHDVMEIYYFLSGDCTYLIEGTAYRLKPHDLIIKRPLEAHKLIVNSTEVPYERIGITVPIELFDTVCGDAQLTDATMRRPLGTNNRFTADDFGNALCTDVMAQIARRGEEMTRAEFLGHILVLMTETDRVLRQKRSDVKTERRNVTVATRLIEYTNEHLYENLTMQELGDTFFLSYSQVNRIFKQYTGSTAGRYIASKRLLTARDRIRHGATPADACYSCGYNEYSAFYRAYVQYFGCSPKCDQSVTKHETE